MAIRKLTTGTVIGVVLGAVTTVLEWYGEAVEHLQEKIISVWEKYDT